MTYAKGYGANKTTRDYLDEFDEKNKNCMKCKNVSNFMMVPEKDHVSFCDFHHCHIEDITKICGFYDPLKLIKADERSDSKSRVG